MGTSPRIVSRGRLVGKGRPCTHLPLGGPRQEPRVSGALPRGGRELPLCSRGSRSRPSRTAWAWRGALHQIASQEWNLGNLDRAKAGFDRALALRSRWAPGSFLQADSLHSQAFIALERSDLEAAEHFLKRAVAIQERLAPDSFWMAFKLTGLGDVYALRGDLEVAAHHFERALAIRQRLVPEGESVATALVRLGRLKLDRGRHPEARAFFERALAILERVFPEQPTIAAILNNLGDVALAVGRSSTEPSDRTARRSPFWTESRPIGPGEPGAGMGSPRSSTSVGACRQRRATSSKLSRSIGGWPLGPTAKPALWPVWAASPCERGTWRKPPAICDRRSRPWRHRSGGSADRRTSRRSSAPCAAPSTSMPLPWRWTSEGTKPPSTSRSAPAPRASLPCSPPAT